MSGPQSKTSGKADDTEKQQLEEQNPSKGEFDLKNPQLSTRQYLEMTVVNAVMQGMAEIARERPNNPLEYLGNYLLQRANNENK